MGDGGELTFSEAVTGMFPSGLLKGSEEYLRLIKGSSTAFTARWFSNKYTLLMVH